MKKIVFMLLLILCMCLPAYAANFVEIRRDEDALVYADVDSIELRKTYNNEYVVAWFKWIPRSEVAKELFKEYKKTVDHEMQLYAFNKNVRQFQMLSRNIYNKKGNVINSGSWPFQISEYEEIVPGTYSELMYDFAIYYYNR